MSSLVVLVTSQVHSGVPFLLMNTQSRVTEEPGVTTISPPLPLTMEPSLTSHDIEAGRDSEIGYNVINRYNESIFQMPFSCNFSLKVNYYIF